MIKKIVSKPDILLILCPPWDIYMPPLGISYLASYLEKSGIKPLIFDINIQLYREVDKAKKEYWRPEKGDFWVEEEKFEEILGFSKSYLDRYVKDILWTKAPIIGFSVHTGNALFTLELAERIKSRDKNKVFIFGGPVFFGPHQKTFLPLEKLKNVVDIIVVGEGEETLAELMFSLKNKKKETIPGTIFLENGKFSNYLPRPPIKDLDKISFPTFKEFYLEKYLTPTLPLLLSRGCIFRCSFCNDYRLSAPYRWRSPSHVIEEIKYHLRYNHIHNFSFKDLLCNANLKVLREFCELVIREGLPITWDSQAIVRRDMDEELLRKMKEAGCQVLIYGVESCSNRVLAKMKKPFTKEDVQKVLADTHRVGIKTFINIIVGFPGETEEDFLETYNFIRDNRRNIDSIGCLSTCLVNAETDLDENQQNYGIILPDFPKKRARFWQDVSGNNYDLRRKRAERLIFLLKELNLFYDYLNV